MYQIKIFIDMEQSSLSMFCLYQFGMCPVSYTANDSIYHFCIMIKTSISFSRVIAVQDFETLRLQLRGAIYRPDSFVLMLQYCANLKATIKL